MRPGSDAGNVAPLDAVQQARSWLAARGVAETEGQPAATDAQPKGEIESGPAAADLEADPESVARAMGLRLLAARARTRQELREAMARRAVPDEAATRVLDRFAEVGLIDDGYFAQQWVASRQARRHLSRQRLRQELQRKGVDRDDIDLALSGVDATDELDAARALASKKLTALGRVDAPTRYRRLAGVLSRRGFSGGTIATVLSELLQS